VGEMMTPLDDKAWDIEDPIVFAASERAALHNRIRLQLGEHRHQIAISVDDATGKTEYQWHGHRYSDFIFHEGMLYYADYNPGMTGGSIVAVNLEDGQQAWSKRLEALGDIRHSSYYSRIRIELQNGLLVVRGKEALGHYTEKINLATQETVDHKAVLGSVSKQ
jgi:outer membrane protein assembly factor BamB